MYINGAECMRHCEECGKPKCIYATRVLTAREARELKNFIRKYNYVCGCLITPDVSMFRICVYKAGNALSNFDRVGVLWCHENYSMKRFMLPLQ